MQFGTKPLDENEFPSKIEDYQGVVAFRVATNYFIRTPFHPEIRKLMADHGGHYAGDGWCFSYHKIDMIRRLMARASEILSARSEARPQV